MSRRLTLSLLALSLLVVGCADYQADFVNDKRVDILATTSPTAAAKVQASLQEHFGNPNSLVAWGTLPIEYGEITGTVLAADGDALRVTLNTEPPGALNQVAVVLETKTPQNRTALSYSAANRTLTLIPQDQAAPVPPGTTIRLIGHHLQDGRRLYMQHCMHCHGVTGDGNGPTARYIANHRFNPLPRDYRRTGEFKFTSTKGGVYVSRDDLERTIKLGLAGTYMPSFRMMKDQEVKAIIEYVRFLAMRGEIERRLLTHLQDLMPDDDGNPPSDLKTLEQELAVDGFDEAFADAASLVAERWTNADAPDNLVVPSTPRVPDTEQSRAKGRNLFISTKINCAKCHGEGGRGNGGFLRDIQKNPETNQDYDTPGLRDAWHNMIEPRNLTSGIYRGGRRPLDVFRRVTVGIKSTPMAGFAALTEQQRWHIVNYVLSIPIDGAFFDEHNHQYHGGTNPHAGHDHSHEHPHEHPPATDSEKPVDKPDAESKATTPEPAKDKK